jgi:hypothetical protein
MDPPAEKRYQLNLKPVMFRPENPLEFTSDDPDLASLLVDRTEKSFEIKSMHPLNKDFYSIRFTIDDCGFFKSFYYNTSSTPTPNIIEDHDVLQAGNDKRRAIDWLLERLTKILTHYYKSKEEGKGIEQYEIEDMRYLHDYIRTCYAQR